MYYNHNINWLTFQSNLNCSLKLPLTNLSLTNLPLTNLPLSWIQANLLTECEPQLIGFKLCNWHEILQFYIQIMWLNLNSLVISILHTNFMKVLWKSFHINDLKGSSTTHIYILRQIKLSLQLGLNRRCPINGGSSVTMLAEESWRTNNCKSGRNG